MNNFSIEQEAIKFEDKIQTALQIKHKHISGIPEGCIKYFTMHHIDLIEFIEIYKSQSIYPQIQFKGLVYNLMDIKFQIILFSEFHVGLYNHLVNKFTSNGQSFESNPYLLLRHLSLDQDSIVKSRIIWERIMNFVYFLETGNKIPRFGKKQKFFNRIKKSDSSWKCLDKYQILLKNYDDDFRNQEIHDDSILRKNFMDNTCPNTSKIFELSNTAINVFWGNLKLILTGKLARLYYKEF